MKKICIVVSSPMTVKAFLLKHIEQLSINYEVTVVMSSSINLKEKYGVSCYSKEISIDRKINIIKDLKSILNMYRFLKKNKFDLVLSVSPKAGLISSISAFLARIKIRIHFFTGQVWVTKKGLFKLLLKSIDKLIGRLNTNNLVDSHSQSDFLFNNNIIKKGKTKVLASGSISGVDIDKFFFDKLKREKYLNDYKILENEIVFMFIGRLNVDKGILDLAKAFEKLLKANKKIKLFLIGPDEGNIESKIPNLLKNESVIRLDFVENPQDILNIADVLILPSYREGFGTIVIEAASMSIPCIGSNIYGLNDAIVNNKTGLLHEKNDVCDMISKYKFAIENIDTLKEYGKNAKKRVYEEFSDEYISIELKKYLDGLLKNG